MKFWDYIGEFLLFRWLFGKFHKSRREHDALTNGKSDLIDVYSRNQIVNYNDDTDSIHDNFGEDADDSEDMDDLDLFIQNDSVRESGNKSHRSGNYSNLHDWSSGNYEQSFDDFYEEQDDFDIMDDI